MTSTLDDQVKSYPTTPDVDGWYYDTDGDEALCIETSIDDQDNIFKRIQLKGGRVALMRELTGKESNKAAAIAGKNNDLRLPAYIALSTTITDKAGANVVFVAEDVLTWKAQDMNRLQTACSILNF